MLLQRSSSPTRRCPETSTVLAHRKKEEVAKIQSQCSKADLLKTTTRSAMSNASSWSCVTRTAVTPTRLMIFLTPLRTLSRTCKSLISA